MTRFLPFLLVALIGCSDPGEAAELLARSGDVSSSMLASPDTGQLPILRRMSSARSANQDYATGRASPDGSLLAYVDWTTGDVAIHDFATGESTLLTDKGTWGENGSWAENAIFSPDGSRVVFLYGNVRASEDANFLYELRIIDADGTDERVLRHATRDELYYQPMDWRDDRGILIERNYRGGPDGRADLVTLDPESGRVHVILEVDPGAPHPHRATFSPDGRLVAAQMDRAVVVLDLDGREVARAPRGGLLMGWTRDGRGIVTYGGPHAGETGFWHLPFSGRELGEPELLRSSVYGARPLGSANGRYLYTVGVDAPQVHIGTLDLGSGEILASPVPVGTAVEGATVSPAWSPDGRSLAYLRMDGRRNTELMLRSTDGSEVRRIAGIDVRNARKLQWHPDGDAIYFVGRPGEEWALFRVDLARGDVRQVVEGVAQGFAISPDGERAYVRRSGDDWWGGRNGISAVDLESGEEIWFVATGAEPGNNLAVTQDGSGVLFTVSTEEEERLEILDADGEARRTLASVRRPDFISPNGSLTAVRGGEILYLVWRDGSDRNRELWSVPVAGGEARMIMDGVGAQLALHPDGRRFAVQAGEWRHEIWAMERVEEALAQR